MKKQIGGFPYISYGHKRYPPAEMLARSNNFFRWLDKRRSVRSIGNEPVAEQVIENVIRAASTAPSGAHKQPWTFCVVANQDLKRQIREAAEQEEYESYQNRMSQEWLEALAPLGTDWHKPFLELAPYLIVVFKKAHNTDGSKNYYVNESVGIACGFLLAAIHDAGLVALTHTPSPMNFLSGLLARPDNERPFLLIPVGYAEKETFVPDLNRKPLADVAVFYR
jgi:nitroreductase